MRESQPFSNEFAEWFVSLCVWKGWVAACGHVLCSQDNAGTTHTSTSVSVRTAGSRPAFRQLQSSKLVVLEHQLDLFGAID